MNAISEQHINIDIGILFHESYVSQYTVAKYLHLILISIALIEVMLKTITI